jgi:hypothetical protein
MNEVEPIAPPQEVERVPRNWRLFERRAAPPPFRLQPRDLDIIRHVFRHRFLRPQHIHTLLGGSAANLNRRYRLLWEHRFLERPLAQRPLKYLTEQIVYGLGPQGVAELRRLDPRLRDAELDWVETPKKQRGWPFIDHQLGTSDFFVCLQVAAERAGLELRWGGHFNLKRHRIALGEVVIQPDGYFTLFDPVRRKEAHHYLEVDRGNISLSRMRERYLAYYRFWKEGRRARPFEHFRVLTVAPNESHMLALRGAAAGVGKDRQHPRAWWGLWFTHAGSFGIEQPERLLGPVFQHAYDAPLRSMVEDKAPGS